jgi:hypothetical protein
MLLAQHEELAQDAHLVQRQAARALDAQELVGVEARPGRLERLEARALAAQDGHAPARLELGGEGVHQRHEVVRVEARVGHLLARQRALRPVGALLGLVELEAEALRHDRRQPGRLHAQRRRRDARVEQVREAEAELALEDQDVVLAVVEDLGARRIGQQLA